MKTLLSLLLLLLATCSLLLAQGQVIKGNASYYADKFHGQRTASGEIYNKDSMTCAHLKYPFGTILKVRNPLNDKTVYVRVTDRGPYVKSRIIDLSRAAARELDIIRAGFSMVEITPFLPNEVPFLPDENGPLELPELDLLYMPAATFPVPAWQNDTMRVTEQLKKLTSTWNLTSP
jgi:rare lipoprotein A